MHAMPLCLSDSTSFDENLMNINSYLFCLKPKSNYSEPQPTFLWNCLETL